MPRASPMISFVLSMRVAFFALLALASVPAVSAQVFQYERSLYSSGGYYKYTETGDLAVRAQAWGAVRYPGLHEMPQGTRLSTLLSLAGGPNLIERRRQDERTLVVRFYHTGAEGEMRLVFEQSMTNELSALQQDPVLQEGDVLVVDSVVRLGYTWRDYVPIASGLISAAVLVVQLLK